MKRPTGLTLLAPTRAQPRGSCRLAVDNEGAGVVRTATRPGWARLAVGVQTPAGGRRAHRAKADLRVAELRVPLDGMTTSGPHRSTRHK